MKCPKCQFENPTGMNFCGMCGRSINAPCITCPSCGFENNPHSKFCVECGTRLSEHPQFHQTLSKERTEFSETDTLQSRYEDHEPSAERRQLTVMFCDLVGSTDLSGKLDPEELREIVRAYQKTSANVITRFEGHIAQYLGDGLLVYFGYPLAHEDDAHRGVRSGLGIIEEIDRLNDRLKDERDITLSVRIGIHTGLVVVGEMGGGERRERLALGETPNIAARLQGLADPNTVVISSATHRLIEGFFHCESKGTHALKGVLEPMEVYQVSQEIDVYSRFEVAVGTGLTPLVGREGEVKKIVDCWENVKNSQGQVLLIIGEAGMGKSRLLQAFNERIEDEPHTWMICRGSSYYQNTPFYPVIDLLQRQLEFDSKDSSDMKINKIEDAMSQYGFPLPEAVPFLAYLLSIPTPDHYPPISMTAKKQKQHILEILLTWLLKISEQQPLIFVMENLHWVDPSTLEHLTQLMDHGSKARILIIFTFRPQINVPDSTQSQLIEIMLERLSHKQIVAMVKELAGGKDFPAEVLHQLIRMTDGVPLFVEELTKMILESGILKEDNGRYKLNGTMSHLAIPATLQDSLMARLDQLGSYKEVVQLAATIGRDFSYELIKELSPLDHEVLQQELTKLVKAGVLHQEGVPPKSQYSFQQALIQDAAYHSVLKGTRQKYHQRIGKVLEKRSSEDNRIHPEIIAHHYTEGGLTEEAISCWLKAGQMATQRSANLEAINHLNKGLSLVHSLPDSKERNNRELTLQVALGVPMTATKGFAAQEVENVYARARELCQHLGDKAQLFRVLRGLWLFYLVRAELKTAHEIGMVLLGLADKAQESSLILQANLVLGLTLFYLGEFKLAKKHFEQGIEIYNPKEHQELAYVYGDDPGVVCLTYSALVLWMLGYPDQAIKRDQEALTLAKDISHPFSLAVSLNFSARLHQCRRDGDTTLERAEATTRLSSEQGFTHWLTTGKILQGWAMAQKGKKGEAIDMMREGLSAWQAMGAEVSGPHCISLLAEVYGRVGQPDKGLDILLQAFEMVEKNGERLYEPELHRLKGELLLQSKEENISKAESCFHQAIHIASHQNAKSLELRATMSLSRLLIEMGRKEEAKKILTETYDWFTEGFTTRDLREAKELLERLILL